MYSQLLKELRKGQIHPIHCRQKDCESYRSCSRIPLEVVGDAKNIKYLFVASFPDPHDNQTKRPFSFIGGMTLRNTIARLKPKHTYAFTTACKTVVESGTPKSVRDALLTVCRENFLNEIERFDPEIIVFMGKEALTAMFPSDTPDIEKIHGNYYGKDSKGRRYYVTFNPTYLLNNPDRLGELYYDIAYLFGRHRPRITITYGESDCDKSYVILHNVKEVQDALKSMYYKSNPVVLDIESDSLSRLHGTILTFQLYNGGKNAFIIPWKHTETPFTYEGMDLVRKYLNNFFDGNGKFPFVVGHNLKYDFTVTLKCAGIEIKTPLMDTMSAAYMLDETHAKDDGDDADQTGITGGYGLGSQLIKYGYYDEWYFKAKNNRSNLAKSPLEYVARYGGGDVVLNYELLRCQFEEAKAQEYYKECKRFLIKFYSEQVKLFSTLEVNGVAVDVQYLAKLMSTENSPLLTYMEKVKKTLYSLPSAKKANRLLTTNQKSVFGELWVFDVDKPDHARTLFFDVLNLKPLSYGKHKDGSVGAPSLDKNFLKHYASHKEVKLLTKLRRVKQLYGLYPKAFHAKISNDIDCSDGRIRANFKGMSTRSGRGSCNDPNLQQNIREDGSALVKIIRGLFIAPHEKVLVKLDIMANEIRCWGNIAEDDKLLKAVMHGFSLRKDYFTSPTDTEYYEEVVKIEGDIHRSNAAAFNTKRISKVTDDERQDSKNTTFGTIYGLSDFNLAKRLKKSVEETKEIKRKFFTTFGKGKNWLDEVAKFAEKNLYCESPLGRRRRLWHFLVGYPLAPDSTLYMPLLDNDNKRVRHIHGMGRRRAQNTPIQALGSDIAFIGAFLVRNYIEKFAIEKDIYDWKLYNVVHDSLEAEIPVCDIEKYILLSKIAYEKVTSYYLKKVFGYELKIPVEVDYEIGFSGNKMEKWDGCLNTLKDLQIKYLKLSKDRNVFAVAN